MRGTLMRGTSVLHRCVSSGCLGAGKFLPDQESVLGHS